MNHALLVLEENLRHQEEDLAKANNMLEYDPLDKSSIITYVVSNSNIQDLKQAIGYIKSFDFIRVYKENQ